MIRVVPARRPASHVPHHLAARPLQGQRKGLYTEEFMRIPPFRPTGLHSSPAAQEAACILALPGHIACALAGLRNIDRIR